MQVSKNTIDKFFEGRCTSAEAENVAVFLYENPLVLDQYFIDGWSEDTVEDLSAGETHELLYNINQAIIVKQPARVKLLTVFGAVAASLLVIFMVKWMLFTPKPVSKTIADTVADISWHTAQNTTAAAFTKQLEDGTVVTVYPKSSLTWKAFGNSNKRNVYMQGHAAFSVAKNKEKPFTVFANGVATTALGTMFDVHEYNGRVSVKLFEGHVVIKEQHVLKGWKKEAIYLEPGEEFLYDSARGIFEVKPVASGSSNKKLAHNSNTHPDKTIRSNNWFMFNNQPLAKVLQQLENIYNVEIECRGIDMQKVYFIGKFDKTDSAAGILNSIVLLKGYHLQKEGGKFIITP